MLPSLPPWPNAHGHILSPLDSRRKGLFLIPLDLTYAWPYIEGMQSDTGKQANRETGQTSANLAGLVSSLQSERETMSKKHYQAIAAAIYDTRAKMPERADAGVVLTIVTNKLLDIMEEDNPRFDRERFVEACETGKCRGWVTGQTTLPHCSRHSWRGERSRPVAPEPRFGGLRAETLETRGVRWPIQSYRRACLHAVASTFSVGGPATAYKIPCAMNAPSLRVQAAQHPSTRTSARSTDLAREPFAVTAGTAASAPMDDKTRSELEALVRSKLGAALVRIRWDQTTAAERSDHARMMARARWGENRPRKRSKPKPK